MHGAAEKGLNKTKGVSGDNQFPLNCAKAGAWQKPCVPSEGMEFTAVGAGSVTKQTEPGIQTSEQSGSAGECWDF